MRSTAIGVASAFALAGALACATTGPIDSTRRIGLQAEAVSPVNADGTLNALIEIPAGTNQKWELAADGKAIEWQRLDDGSLRIVQYLPYPANYGMVPGTSLPKDEGGDGDALDVIVLGPALERGALVRVHLIGVLVMLDGGEIDDKLLAVSDRSPFSRVRDVLELDEQFPGTTSILATWFGHYKGPGRIEVKGVRDRDAALAILAQAESAGD